MDLLATKFLKVVVFYFATQRCTLAQNNWDIYNYNNDRWIWGYDDVINTTYPVSQPLTTTTPRNLNTGLQTKDDDYKKYEVFCTDPGLKVPDFRAPGKRLAQVKCDEERWRINNENEVFKRKLKCTYYNAIKQEKETGEEVWFGTGQAVGGRNALDGEFPHMGAVGYKSDNGTFVYLCGGSLINRRYILTAAHCIYAPGLIDPTPKIVRLGNTRLEPLADFLTPEQRSSIWGEYNITRIIPHPQYKSPIKYYDIAILELEKDVDYNEFIQPACLWHDGDLTRLGTEATLTGWGVTETEFRTIATVLQAAVVDILDSQLCNVLLKSKCNKKWCGFRDHQVCAGKLEGGVDACQGDSGGPLQVKIDLGLTPLDDKVVRDRLRGFKFIKESKMHYVFGVTSFGIGCAQKNLPGVYSRVSSFLDWIENIVWK